MRRAAQKGIYIILRVFIINPNGKETNGSKKSSMTQTSFIYESPINPFRLESRFKS